MNAEKLGLYINTMLISSPAVGSHASAPLYPRPRSPEDAMQKLEVFRLSLRSMARLRPSKVLFNVELGEGFEEFSKETITLMMQKIFPDSELRSEAKRPTSLPEWQASAQLASHFFGEGTPLVCCFNHDHIFVDYRTEPFLCVIKEIFSKHENQDAFLGYSHAPEVISIFLNADAYRHRLASTMGMVVDLHSIRRHTESLICVTEKGRIDGIFVSTPRGLMRMWMAARSTTDYIPRPDWPGIAFPETDFVCYLQPREFFRHFDGYGHVTTMPRNLGLSFDDFDLGSGIMKAHNPLLAIERNKNGDRNAMVIYEVAEAYINIFKDNYFLCLRDHAFWCLTVGHIRPALIQALERAYGIFRRTYLDAELEGEVHAQVEYIVKNILFGSANSIATEILSDCQNLAVSTCPPDKDTMEEEPPRQQPDSATMLLSIASKMKRKLLQWL